MTSCKNAGQATNGLMMTVMMVMAGGVRDSDAGEARRCTPERHAASALPRAPRSRLLGRRSPSPPGPLLLTSTPDTSTPSTNHPCYLHLRFFVLIWAETI